MLRLLLPLFALLLGMATTLTLCGCATVGRVVKSQPFLGASIGATAGSITGTALAPTDQAITGTLIGAASGAVLGALVGYLTDPTQAKKVEIPTNRESPKDPEMPGISSPEVRRVWVPAHIDGSNYYQGHFMYVIERGSVWTMQ
jgi:hypothetical protein